MKQNYTNKHIEMLKRSAGLKTNGTKYEYITTRDEMIDSFIRRMDDLGYPLRVEPKRDRYVLNKKSLEKAIIDITIKEISKIENEIVKWINTDVSDMIESNVIDIWNDITNLGVTNNKPRAQKHWTTRLGEQVGKAIGNAVSDYIDDVLNVEGKKR